MFLPIPDALWELSIFKREILAELSDEIHELIKYHFEKANIESFGMIINIHTFGRDSKFNTHFHVLFTEGGFDKNGNFKQLRYIQGKTLNNIWRSKVLNIFKKHFKNFPDKIKIIDSLRDNNFFIDIKGKPLKNDEKSIKYFGRYLARPAIAEHRIIDFDDKNVTFWYMDINSNKKETITLPVFKFIGRLILHIPPKGFKMVRRYGFYARRKTEAIKLCLNKFKNKKLFNSAKLSWNEKIKLAFGKDPLVCPRCNSKMILSEFHHKIYGSRFYT